MDFPQFVNTYTEEPGFDVRRFVRSDTIACTTYGGYIKIVWKDLQYSPLTKGLKGKPTRDEWNMLREP